jgi:serine protease Do
MTAGSGKIDKRWPLRLFFAAAVSVLSAFGAPHAEGLDSSAQWRLHQATFEVVLEKPVSDPLSYEKTLPLELLPYAERVGKYRPLGTAFAIGHDRFATAAHVITAPSVRTTDSIS